MNKYFHTIKALIKTFSPYNYKILLKKEKGPKKKKKTMSEEEQETLLIKCLSKKKKNSTNNFATEASIDTLIIPLRFCGYHIKGFPRCN